MSSAKTTIKWMERCLWAAGFTALIAWIAYWGNSQWQQVKGSRELDRLVSVPSVPVRHSQIPPKLKRGDLIGRIEIPRLNVSTVIFEGTDDAVLRDGAGHLSGSALPDQKGNVVVAGHRDSFFRPLRNIEKRDEISLVTPSGTRHYRVDSTEIVTPDRIDVTAPTPDAELTLITCYPFDWWGHAPQRFIVRAREIHDVVPVARPAARPVAPKIKPVAVPVASVEPPPEVVEDLPVIDEPAPVATPQSNRVVRGLRKLNPKGLFAKLSGS